MKKEFGVEVGLSDHSLSPIVPVVAVALGAKMIEKHFILDRKLGGPDATFSLEPAEFKKMVSDIREAEKSFGKITYELSAKTKRNRMFSRSLFIIKDVIKGEKFSNENVRSIRPGYGLHPKYFKKVIGKKAKTDIKRGTPLLLKHF